MAIGVDSHKSSLSAAALDELGRMAAVEEESVKNVAQDPASAEADLIDLRVRLLAENEGLDKGSAYQKYLSSPDGMRKLADLRLVQGRYAEEDHLRSAAQWLEQRNHVPRHPICT